MRAVVVERFMQPGELRVQEAPEPVTGPGQIKLAVRAAGRIEPVIFERYPSTPCPRRWKRSPPARPTASS
jgi:hypothetical protein